MSRLRLIATLAAVVASVAVPVGVSDAANVSAADPSACKITSPPEGWPNGGVRGYNTKLHMGHDTDWANDQPRPVGDLKAIMLFVDFPNATAAANPAPYNSPQAYYDLLVPGGTAFFRTTSYNRFRLTVDAPRKFYRMHKNDNQYGMGYIVAPEVQSRYIQEAVNLAEADVDFRQYSLIYVVPTRNARAIPYSPEWNDYAGNVRADGKVFKNGVTFGQDAWRWGYKIFNHENGHAVGLPENYNATGSGSLFGFTGDWDVMGNINAIAPDFFAWEKWKLGWLDDDQAVCVTTDTQRTAVLTPLGTPGGTKLVVVRTGRYTAFIAEVRQRTGVDSRACDKGLLVYKLDASIANGAGPIRVIDSHPSTGCGNSGLNDAPFDVGEVTTFTDSGTRTRIEILGSSGGSYTVRATNGTPGTDTVWADDFESDKAWQSNPDGTDTATGGRWERAVPQGTSFNGTPMQLATAASGRWCLVTGASAGSAVGENDVDGGITTMRSPRITLPGSGTLTLTFSYYLAHLDNASSADRLVVKVLPADGAAVTVLARAGAAVNTAAAWRTATVDLSTYSGREIQIVVDAADLDTGSLIEAAVDDMRITQR